MNLRGRPATRAFFILLLLQAEAQASPDYIALALRYARGERAAAVAELGSWTKGRLSQELDELRKRALANAAAGSARSFETMPLRAIVMLHTDRDEWERRPTVAAGEQPPPCGTRLHAEVAERAVVLLMGDPEGRDFARRWHLAMALRGLAEYCFEDGRRFAHEGLKWFAKDAELLLVSGVIDEAVASLAETTPVSLAVLSPRQRAETEARVHERLILLGSACHAFEQALLADRNLLEAELHLGRVRFWREEKEPARAALQVVLAGRPDPDLEYLAHLFLGRVHEDEGRLKDAEGQYREALVLDPSAQAAAMALSCVLQAQGEPDAARVVLEGALAYAGRRDSDPFWSYLFARTRQADAILEALREESGP